jgi:hypothetical protein
MRKEVVKAKFGVMVREEMAEKAAEEVKIKK